MLSCFRRGRKKEELEIKPTAIVETTVQNSEQSSTQQIQILGDSTFDKEYNKDNTQEIEARKVIVSSNRMSQRMSSKKTLK
jgi:hypothetical protein